MAIEDVLTRISAIQARFGVTGNIGTSEFEGLLSDAARHGGLSPIDPADAAVLDEETVASAGSDATSGSTRDAADESVGDQAASGQGTSEGSVGDQAASGQGTSEGSVGGQAASGQGTSEGSVADQAASGQAVSAPAASEATPEQAAPVGAPAATDVVSILDGLGVSTDVRSGEELEALAAASAPALTTAAALGATGSSSLLDLVNDQLGAEGGTALLASMIAQQQAGAGIVRATGS